MQFETSLAPGKNVEAELSQGIVDFNSAAIAGLEPNKAEVKFFVLARGYDGELIGGIRASCYWNTLHIELLWLSEAARGLGAGRRLMEMAEAFAVERGCENALVETTSWQAKPFYEKNGYRLMATLEGRPKGHASHYLSKKLVAISA
ncbi:MAG: GNAT family N-acetyltransferase [Pacificimonas sp.]